MTTVGMPTRARPRVRRLWQIGLVLVLALGCAAVGAETYYRHRITNCVTAQVRQELGSEVSVDFGPKPLLLTAIDHRLQYVDIDSRGAGFGPAVDMRVHARLNDIRLIDNGRGGVDLGSSSAEAAWSNEGIARTLQGLASAVRSDAHTGVVSIEILGGLAELRVRPRITGEQIELNTQSAQLFGLGLPTYLVDGIVDLLTESLRNNPLGLKPTEVRITDSGIALGLTGGRTELVLPQNTEAYNC